MAYSDYTSLLKLYNELGIQHTKAALFEGVAEIAPSPRLVEDLLEAQSLFSLTTEKAKSEFLIVPILKEIKRMKPEKIGVFSGVSLEVNVSNLSGFCDFILTNVPNTIEVTAPIFCLVEAKNRTLEEGLAQCAAEMYAAFLFNQQYQQEIPFVYGSVTNGYEWLFLRLENPSLVQIDTQHYSIAKVEKLLGIFGYITDYE